MPLPFSVVAAAFALFLTSSAVADEADPIRIATEGAYPPFSYVDDAGTLKGFDVDIAGALCKAMEAKCEIVAEDWEDIIPALLHDEVDAVIASMAITPQRKRFVDFAGPYYRSGAMFGTRTDSGITDSTPEALAGKSLGAQKDTTHARYLQETYPGSDIRLYPDYRQVADDLAAGTLDAALADTIVLHAWLENSEAGACCHAIGEKLTDEAFFGTGAGIAIRHGDEALKAKLDKALAQILADGTYEEINAKYFAFPIR